jgi:hypothetical protein
MAQQQAGQPNPAAGPTDNNEGKGNQAGDDVIDADFTEKK